MSKKDKKITKIGPIDAEFKPIVSESNPDQDKIVAKDEGQAEALNKALSELLKKHQEKGSLAFELLKSVISQKLDTVAHESIKFDKIVTGVYSLADAFKNEMDQRWSNEVAEVSGKIYGKVEDTSEVVESAETSKTIN